MNSRKDNSCWRSSAASPNRTTAPVDREMLPDIAQEIDVVEGVQPVGNVRHDGTGGPSPKVRNFEKVARMLRRFSLINSSVRILRLSSLPEGSPTRVVAAAHQRDRPWPVCCIQYSIMVGSKLPTCSDGAVQS